MSDIDSQTITLDEDGNYMQSSCLAMHMKLTILLVGPVLSCAYLMVGTLFLGDCPAQPKIPYYLIIAGSAAFIWFCQYAARKSSLCLSSSIPHVILSCLLLTWVLLFGNIWIYQISEPAYEDTLTDEAYCHPTLYRFAFITNTFWNVVVILSIFRIVGELIVNR